MAKFAKEKSGCLIACIKGDSPGTNGMIKIAERYEIPVYAYKVEDMIYDFQTQLNEGKHVEILLDNFFSKWYNVAPVDLEIEKSEGIDRIFTSLNGSKYLKIEYKADFKTIHTGNIYLELSVDGDNGYHKDGWALHSKADLVIYTVVGEDKYQILAIEPSILKSLIPQWESIYRRTSCKNVGYGSTGLLVPLDVVVQVAYKKFVCNVVAK